MQMNSRLPSAIGRMALPRTIFRLRELINTVSYFTVSLASAVLETSTQGTPVAELNSFFAPFSTSIQVNEDTLIGTSILNISEIPVVNVVLNALTISSTTFYVDSTAGTVIGTLSGRTTNSTLSISPNDGRFAFSGNNLLIGLTASTAGNIPISITESIDGVSRTSEFTLIAQPSNQPAAYTFINTEAEALIARFTVKPDDTRKQLIDARFTAGKAKSFWSKLDVLQVYASHDSQAALINWLGASYTAQAMNTVTFVADRGLGTNGIDSYIDMGFDPSVAGSKYIQNSASFGFRNNIESDATASMAGNYNTTAARGLTVNPRQGNMVSCRINNGTGLDIEIGAGTTAIGLFTVSRSSSTSVKMYRGNQSIASGSKESGEVVAGNLRLGSISSASYRTGQFSIAFAGSALTDQEVADIYDWFEPYRTAIGL